MNSKLTLIKEKQNKIGKKGLFQMLESQEVITEYEAVDLANN